MPWIDRSGDRDRDGLQEYKTRSSHGYYNQGWKDAGDAIQHADGTLAPLPIALVRAPGLRLRRQAADGRHLRASSTAPEDAERLRREADGCTSAFNDAFWWEAEGTYYLGLDGDKRPIESRRLQRRPPAWRRASCRWSGPSGVVERLMAPTTCGRAGASGRCRPTTSRYNPFSYHTGSVWPHDNAIDRRRLPALRLRRRGRPGRPRHVRRDRAVPGQPAARAVRRPAPRGGQLPGPVPRRQRARRRGRPARSSG